MVWLALLAAVLAILGYSVNESVVVFDRIRENFRRMRNATVPEIIDNAITRTIDFARVYANAARDALSVVPDTVWRSALVDLVDFVVERAH